MAKKLYDEVKIEAIANKIRDLVPNLYKADFNTAEMPEGVERVYEEGKRKGRTEGYSSGYGTGYSEGFTKGDKNGYDKGYNEGYSEGSLTSNGGYDDGHHAGYQKGLVEGIEKVKTEEARTSEDLELERLGKYDLGLTVNPGYYGEGVSKMIDVAPYYNEGYEEGKSEGGGAELPTLTIPGTADDLLKGKQLIDGEGNIVTGTIETAHGGLYKSVLPQYDNTASGPIISMAYEVEKPTYISPGTGPKISLTTFAENFGTATANSVPKGSTFTSKEGLNIEGTAEIRTINDVAYSYDDVTEAHDIIIPAGYYATKTEYNIDQVYDNGYDTGYDKGAENLKTEEARTSSDVTHSVTKIAATVTIPSGYYAKEVKRVLDVQDGDLDPIVDAAYDEGADVGYNNGYDTGHTEGYNEGYAQGKSEGVELPALTNPGTAGDLLEGKELIDGNGNIVTGTIPTRTNAYIRFGEVDVSEKGLYATALAGYYPQDTRRWCALDAFYATSYNEGYNEGYDSGHTEGWHEGYDVGLAAGGGSGSGIQLGQYLFDLCSTVTSSKVNVQAFNYNTNYFLHLYITIVGSYDENPLDNAIDVWEVEAVIEPDGEWYWDSDENECYPDGPNMNFLVYVGNIAFSENGEL